MRSEDHVPAKPTVTGLDVRRIRPEDQGACRSFSCGEEEWHLDVSRFLTHRYWQPGRQQEQTIIALLAGTATIFGFGCWKHTHAELPQRVNPIPVIRIPYFGVHEDYQGAKDAEGRGWAGRLYATLENDALGHPESAPDMPIELYCDRRNEPGLRFWCLRGFRYVRDAQGDLLQLVRVPG